MTCPYLWGVYLRSCSATRDVYVPGALEMKSYCAPESDSRFALCPNYRRISWRAPGTADSGIVPDTEVT